LFASIVGQLAVHGVDMALWDVDEMAAVLVRSFGGWSTPNARLRALRGGGPALLLYQNEQKENENETYFTYLWGPCPAALVLTPLGCRWWPGR